jgi:hypothetical protein
LFAIAIEISEINELNIPETLFMIYGLGFSLEKVAAMQEHGIGGSYCEIPNTRTADTKPYSI